MARPLEGFRILSVEQYGAGPFGTQHLADMGAEVIKIENHRLGGDYARELGPYFTEGAEKGNDSQFYQSINRNKKSVSIDLASPEGKSVFSRLAATADGVANNLRGDVPEKLGLTYEALSKYNKAIVCAHCSAYGREGPRADWPGYDFLMQAEAGYFHMSGEPDTPPTRMGLSVVDFMGGTYMALGLLAGIMGAQKTGTGRDIDVNLYDTALSNLSYLGVWALNSDYNPARVARSAHASLVPCQLYKTADSWIYIMCNKEKFWTNLCHEISKPEWIQDVRFADFSKRFEHRDLLTGLIDEALSADTSEKWLERFSGKVPAAPVRTPREALMDQNLEKRGKIQKLKHNNNAAEFNVLTAPIQFGENYANENKSNRETAENQDKPCSPLGADTVDLLLQAGFSATELEELQKNGII
jgi:succinate---hydroxymethylglutarate CoA-transferase